MSIWHEGTAPALTAIQRQRTVCVAGVPVHFLWVESSPSTYSGAYLFDGDPHWCECVQITAWTPSSAALPCWKAQDILGPGTHTITTIEGASLNEAFTITEGILAERLLTRRLGRVGQLLASSSPPT